MSEFKSLNGYPVKDEIARQNLSDYKTENAENIRALNEKIDKEVEDRKNDKENTLKEVEKRTSYPELTEEQKSKIKSLANKYYNNNKKFVYFGDLTRNDYANGNAYITNSSRFGINCELFPQLVWMGRDPVDFIDKSYADYTPEITKSFDFGYYFNFEDRQLMGHSANRDENGNIIGYFDFVKPNPDSDEGSYSASSRYSENSENPNHQTFMSFMCAGDMAYELYKMGCEIPLSEVQVGDLIFNTSRAHKTWLHDNQWRDITHVSLVVGKNDKDGLVLYESTDMVTGNSIIYRTEKSAYASNRARVSNILHNAVFIARHPIAFGYEPNVPSSITYTPHSNE